MLEHIVFIAMVIIAAGAGIWIWWMEYHGSAGGAQKDSGTADREKETKQK